MTQNMIIAGRPWLVPVNLDPEADREAWIEDRLKGYGGSDAAAIVGENFRRAPIDVWNERTTGVDAFTDNDRTYVGRKLEPVVIGMFAKGGAEWPRDGGELFVAKPPTVYHRDRPWQRGSADGLVYEPEAVAWAIPGPIALTPHGMWAANGAGVYVLNSAADPDALLEVKTHGFAGARGYDDEDDGVPTEVPSDKRIQCQWYMELYQIARCYLATLVDTHLRKTYVIERDRELGASLLTEVESFHRRYVLTGEPPPPDGSKSYKEYLAKRYKLHTAELVDATPEVEEATLRLLAVKAEQKELEGEREDLEQVIKARIAGDLGVRTSLGAITWKSQASGKLREKAARAELYEVAGWTNAEIRAFEEKHKQPDHRVMRTPK